MLLNGVIIGIVGKYETARRSYWHFEKNENCPKPDKEVKKSSDNTRFGAVWNEIGDLMF